MGMERAGEAVEGESRGDWLDVGWVKEESKRRLIAEQMETGCWVQNPDCYRWHGGERGMSTVVCVLI